VPRAETGAAAPSVSEMAGGGRRRRVPLWGPRVSGRRERGRGWAAAGPRGPSGSAGAQGGMGKMGRWAE